MTIKDIEICNTYSSPLVHPQHIFWNSPDELIGSMCETVAFLCNIVLIIEIERQREIQRHRQIETERERQRQIETERERERQRETEREKRKCQKFNIHFF